ncbi:MAG: hypothetical protein BWY71_01780 [Planctomycetes bacterium ADurb.Bin412]|nr:MAG: hypothetical protein BWY71_01780 [Planctomycetes bacterium ADurb.Bin412]
MGCHARALYTMRGPFREPPLATSVYDSPVPPGLPLPPKRQDGKSRLEGLEALADEFFPAGRIRQQSLNLSSGFPVGSGDNQRGPGTQKAQAAQRYKKTVQDFRMGPAVFDGTRGPFFMRAKNVPANPHCLQAVPPGSQVNLRWTGKYRVNALPWCNSLAASILAPSSPRMPCTTDNPRPAEG